MENERKTLDDRAKMTELERIRHSTAHVLATAILRIQTPDGYAGATSTPGVTGSSPALERHSVPTTQKKRRPQRLFHLPHPRRGRGQREIGALRAAGDASRLHHVPE